jgi:hypothetical protein
MGRSLEHWTRDFLHAARALRRAPGFTIVTVVTLALHPTAGQLQVLAPNFAQAIRRLL